MRICSRRDADLEFSGLALLLLLRGASTLAVTAIGILDVLRDRLAAADLLHLDAAHENTRLERTTVATAIVTTIGTLDATPGIVREALILGTTPSNPPTKSSENRDSRLNSRNSDRDSKDEREDRDRRENGANGDDRKRECVQLCSSTWWLMHCQLPTLLRPVSTTT